jgi:hypothetical protein
MPQSPRRSAKQLRASGAGARVPEMPEEEKKRRGGKIGASYAVIANRTGT